MQSERRNRRKGIEKGKVELYYNEMHLSEKEISEKLAINDKCVASSHARRLKNSEMI